MKYLSPNLLSAGRIDILGWMEGSLVEGFEKLFCDKGFLYIFSSSQVDCLWVLAKKNNPSGATFNLIKFKMFSEGLSFLCICVWCGQREEWHWNGLGLFFYDLPTEASVQWTGQSDSAIFTLL